MSSNMITSFRLDGFGAGGKGAMVSSGTVMIGSAGTGATYGVCCGLLGSLGVMMVGGGWVCGSIGNVSLSISITDTEKVRHGLRSTS